MFDKSTKVFFAISAIALAFVIYMSNTDKAFSFSSNDTDFEMELHKVIGVYADDFYYVIETGKDTEGKTIMYIQDLANNKKVLDGEIIDTSQKSVKSKIADTKEEIGTDYMSGIHVARGRYILETTGFKENIELAKELLNILNLDNIDIEKTESIYVDREHPKVPVGSAQMSFVDIEGKRLLSIEMYFTVDNNEFMLKETEGLNEQKEQQ